MIYTQPCARAEQLHPHHLLNQNLTQNVTDNKMHLPETTNQVLNSDGGTKPPKLGIFAKDNLPQQGLAHPHGVSPHAPGEPRSGSGWAYMEFI